jgi:tRNA (mo5U34)-methyltransferase
VTATLSREDVESRVHQLGAWFHNMNLAGVETAPAHPLGDYPNIKWQLVQARLPHDLQGATVLDVGCNGGFFSIQMKKRGASRVVAVDHDPRYLAQAEFAACVENAAIEFHCLSVYDIEKLREKFDIVLFMGVLYHLRYPLLALDLLAKHSVRGQLIFQSMIRGSGHDSPLAPDYPFTEEEMFDRPDFPKAHFIERRYAGDHTNWWIPNHACAAAMVRSAGFRILEYVEPETMICAVEPCSLDPEAARG